MFAWAFSGPKCSLSQTAALMQVDELPSYTIARREGDRRGLLVSINAEHQQGGFASTHRRNIEVPISTENVWSAAGLQGKSYGREHKSAAMYSAFDWRTSLLAMMSSAECLSL